MADKKISELVSITGSATAADDYFVVVDTSGAVTYKISREELNNAIEQDVLSTVDINGGTIDGTVIGATAPSAGYFTTLITTNTAGIGTISPSSTYRASVYGDGSSIIGGIEFRNAAAGGSTFTVGHSSATSPSATLNVVDSANLIINTANTERMRIDSSGNVGIGTSSPGSYKLNVNGQSNFSGNINLTSNSTIYWNGGDIGIVNSGTNILFKTFLPGDFGERVRITSSGSVNIGGTGGQAKFEINNAVSTRGSLTDTTINLATTGVTGRKANIGFGLAGGVANTNAATIGFDVTNGAGALQGDLFFSTRGSTADSVPTEHMRIDSAGRILCGTTDTDVFNNTSGNGINIKGSAGAIEIAGASGEVLYLNRMGTDGRVVNIRKSGTFIGGIDVTTSAVSYNTSSDYRLKTAVNYDWDATSRLKQLKPARFEWIVDGDDAVPVDGFLAHEVQDIVPEAITGTKDGMVDEEYTVSAATGDIYTPAVAATYDENGVELTAAVDEVIHSTDVERPEELAESQQWRETTAAVMGTRSVPDYQGIDQSKLTPLLTKALIEAVEKIEQLEARITALETN